MPIYRRKSHRKLCCIARGNLRLFTGESRIGNYLQSILTTIKPDKNYKLPMQEYLKSSLLTTREKQLAFALRSGSYNLKVNYKSRFDKDMKCRNSYI